MRVLMSYGLGVPVGEQVARTMDDTPGVVKADHKAVMGRRRLGLGQLGRFVIYSCPVAV